eukprot:49736-Chlamydomonas_euryale.AAC.5
MSPGRAARQSCKPRCVEWVRHFSAPLSLCGAASRRNGPCDQAETTQSFARGGASPFRPDVHVRFMRCCQSHAMAALF